VLSSFRVFSSVVPATVAITVFVNKGHKKKRGKRKWGKSQGDACYFCRRKGRGENVFESSARGGGKAAKDENVKNKRYPQGKIIA